MTAKNGDQRPVFRAPSLPHLDALLSRAGLDDQDRLRARAVAEVLPFRTNSYEVSTTCALGFRGGARRQGRSAQEVVEMHSLDCIRKIGEEFTEAAGRQLCVSGHPRSRLPEA